jgi:hypothetical protein
MLIGSSKAAVNQIIRTLDHEVNSFGGALRLNGSFTTRARPRLPMAIIREPS